MNFDSCSIFLNGIATTKSVHLRKIVISKNEQSVLASSGAREVCIVLTDN